MQSNKNSFVTKTAILFLHLSVRMTLGFKCDYLPTKYSMLVFYYINPNKMHMSQSLFYLTTALHVSGATITHLQEH